MTYLEKAIELSRTKKGWINMPEKDRAGNIVCFYCPNNWIENAPGFIEDSRSTTPCTSPVENCNECWNLEYLEEVSKCKNQYK